MNRLNNESGSQETKGCAVSSGNEAGLVVQLFWFVASFVQQNFHLNRRLRRCKKWKEKVIYEIEFSV